MSSRRCFLCAAAMLAPGDRRLTDPSGRERAFPVACGSCGVLTERDADPAACWRDLGHRLAAPTFVPDLAAPYGLDLYTLRIAATRLGRGLAPLDPEGRAALLAPHSRRAARARLHDLGEGPPVSLGLLCRPAELAALLAGLAPHAAWTDDVAILLDGAAAPPRAVAVAGFADGAVRVASRPLAGDFAGQRNALQDLARHAWMLQLDADETLEPQTGRLLPALAALAEDGDVVSVGLPRRNRVDGILSDVYPDVQYRLNRTTVRYTGRVHERPVLDGGWRRSFIALHGAIDHRLSRAHVLARSRTYEALDPGRGRIEEEEALLRPYLP
ncbi:hypothetical protein ABZT49_15945 [Methylobacterium sp. EM32]|uniref:hypothetical protein n=1 Tax=Methylobacterium sp. EM32 TaxID=3163481 RepID=UPI0033B4F34C